MSEELKPLHESADAMRWADEFMGLVERIRDEGHVRVVDHGLMLAWFANAIEAGRDNPTRSQEELQAENKRLRETIKQLEADVAHHNQGWDACVAENNGLREQVEKLWDIVADLRSQSLKLVSGKPARCFDESIARAEKALKETWKLPERTTEDG